MATRPTVRVFLSLMTITYSDFYSAMHIGTHAKVPLQSCSYVGVMIT